MAKKIRLDEYLVQASLAEDIKKARALIMAGLVYANDQKYESAGGSVATDAVIEVRDSSCKYVSRGGLKLEKAMAEFPIILSGKTAMDIGASTGGFTDCMLKNGAVKVFAVDVGYGQLAWSLRNDARVVNLERTNIRHVTQDQLGETVDFASIDVSFISLRLVLPVLKTLLSNDGAVVALIKPQFEAEKDQVEPKGIITDPSVHLQVICKVVDFAVEAGFSPLGLSYSPIRGPQGNIEYLLYLSNVPSKNQVDEELARNIVERSHAIVVS